VASISKSALAVINQPIWPAAGGRRELNGRCATFSCAYWYGRPAAGRYARSRFTIIRRCGGGGRAGYLHHPGVGVPRATTTLFHLAASASGSSLQHNTLAVSCVQQAGLHLRRTNGRKVFRNVGRAHAIG